MNRKYFNEIKAREQAATHESWTIKVVHHRSKPDTYAIVEPNLLIDTKLFEVGNKGLADFIAHARTDIPELIAEAERLTAENSELKFERDDYIKIGEDYRNKLLEAESDRDTLKKALELACNSKFRYMPNPDYFIHQAQKQEEKK